ncbi:MAG: hypothetical protein Kow0077_29040 [Anaerolineae bacterium]
MPVNLLETPLEDTYPQVVENSVTLTVPPKRIVSLLVQFERASTP